MDGYFKKVIENFISMKVWVLIAAIVLVFFDKINGGQWMYIALALIGGRVGEYIWKKNGSDKK